MILVHREEAAEEENFGGRRKEITLVEVVKGHGERRGEIEELKTHDEHKVDFNVIRCLCAAT